MSHRRKETFSVLFGKLPLSLMHHECRMAGGGGQRQSAMLLFVLFCSGIPLMLSTISLCNYKLKVCLLVLVLSLEQEAQCLAAGSASDLTVLWGLIAFPYRVALCLPKLQTNTLFPLYIHIYNEYLLKCKWDLSKQCVNELSALTLMLASHFSINLNLPHFEDCLLCRMVLTFFFFIEKCVCWSSYLQ